VDLAGLGEASVASLVNTVMSLVFLQERWEILDQLRNFQFLREDSALKLVGSVPLRS
jgi:hypothetical protein